MRRLLTWSLVALAVAGHGAMVDPAIDAGGEFSYLSKPSTTIGVKAGPEGSQVTFDGAIYTGSAELCFFYGTPLRAVMVRRKQLADDWMPVVTYAWRDGLIAYNLEAFGATLDHRPASNTINFVQVRVQNLGRQAQRAVLASALRYSGGDHRCNRMTAGAFSPDWEYRMDRDSAFRDGKLVVVFPEWGAREAAPGVAYTGPFKGREHQVSERAEVCMVRYEMQLAAGQHWTLEFKMPLAPVSEDDSEQVEAIRGADYETYLGDTMALWQQELAKGIQLHVPEPKVVRTHRASLMYDLIAIDQQGEDWVQKVNELQYDHFWLRDGAYIIRTHDLLGHHDTAEKCLRYFERFQRDDGLFVSQGGQLDGFGQALFALGQHYVITGDMEYARRVYRFFPPAITWLKRARAEDEYHLMPPTHAHDNENIDGRYTGHNFWALLGVRMAVILASDTGHEADAREFLAEYEDYRQAFMARLVQVAGPDGYIPPGLDVEGGQDWGNLLGVYPSEVLDPYDPRVTSTLDKMHRDKYQEGVMTYYSVLHHYVTTNVTQTHTVRGEQEKALTDLYHLLLHTGTTHEGFELGARPWGERDVGGNYPPHGWFAAKYNAVLRNMLVQERGGKGGLEARELHLFSVISPAWAVPGEQVSVRRAPTDMGPISASLSFTQEGADFTLSPQFRRQPARIVLHIPYFVELESFSTDAAESRRVGRALELSPDVTKASLRWRRRQVQPLSYDSVVEQYKREYARRYAEYVASGGKPMPIEAPALLTAEERQQAFDAKWGPEVIGLAYRKPVTVSGGTEAGHAPERVVDGNAYDVGGSSWWAGPPTPRWLQVDLQKVHRLNRVHVFPYWDGGRYYQYTVEVSVDGEDFSQVADMSKNTRPATPKGDVHKFAPIQARYVRVNMLFNSANPSVHLVELRVFEAK